MRLDFASVWRRAEPQSISIGLYALHADDAAPAHAQRATPEAGTDGAPNGVAAMLGTDAIEAALTQALHGAPVRIEIDAAWARLFVLPWAPALSSARRWAQLAASRLAQRYDCASEDWVIRVLPARPPHARLVVALPRTLVDTCMRVCGKQLAALEIDVLTWLQKAAKAQRGWSGCRVEIDDLQAWIFVFRQGALVRVRARRDCTAEALAAAIEAEWAAAVPDDGAEPQACELHWGPRALAAGLDREVAAMAPAPQPRAQATALGAARTAVPA